MGAFRILPSEALMISAWMHSTRCAAHVRHRYTRHTQIIQRRSREKGSTLLKREPLAGHSIPGIAPTMFDGKPLRPMKPKTSCVARPTCFIHKSVGPETADKWKTQHRLHTLDLIHRTHPNHFNLDRTNIENKDAELQPRLT